MEINTQNLEALLQLQEQQAQLPRKSNNQAKGFEALLQNQMAAETANGTTINPLAAKEAQANLYSQLILGTQNADTAVDPDMAALDAAFEQASGALDMWDRYAAVLGSSPENSALRDAYSLLEGIDDRIGELRNNTAVTGNPALNGLLNELEVLSATEKFKFNRGDYLA